MYHIIPYTNYEVKLPHNKEVILDKFRTSVKIVQKLPPATVRSYFDFEGVLFENGFDLRRVMKLGYSAFLPILLCRIHNNGETINLNIIIRFNKFVNIGLVVFFLFQILISPINLRFNLVMVVAYLIILYLYNEEAQLLKEKLKEFIPVGVDPVD